MAGFRSPKLGETNLAQQWLRPLSFADHLIPSGIDRYADRTHHLSRLNIASSQTEPCPPRSEPGLEPSPPIDAQLVDDSAQMDRFDHEMDGSTDSTDRNT